MLDINWIRANDAKAEALLATRKNVPYSVARLIEIDDARRAMISSVEEAQALRNTLSKQIGQAKGQKDEAKASALMAEVAALKDAIQTGEEKRREAEEALRNALLVMPNLPKDDVPVGADEAANVEYFGPNGSAATAAKSRPPKPSFSFTPKEHYEIGETLGMMDFETAAKISGARFTVLKGKLARLERAIGQFMLDLHTSEFGYTEVQPPLLVKDETFYGTGQLPKFTEDLFWTDRVVFEGRFADLEEVNYKDLVEGKARFRNEDKQRAFEGARVSGRVSLNRLGPGDEAVMRVTQRLGLIPTAEVPLTNLVRESILAEDELPLRFTALTPCFRSEAGSAGRDTRGMLRQHQFDKVELVSITTPEQSADEHERMLSCAEEVLKRLGLHYRVMTLSTGDMGFGAQKTYDIEVWLPGQNTYREISSCSVCGDFQARRMDARFKDKAGKIRPVHTLNGSALAVGRTLIAVMENYQQADGTIAVPDALRPYMGGLEVVAK
jgi:seryl-tRNA synthetase